MEIYYTCKTLHKTETRIIYSSNLLPDVSDGRPVNLPHQGGRCPVPIIHRVKPIQYIILVYCYIFQLNSLYKLPSKNEGKELLNIPVSP